MLNRGRGRREMRWRYIARENGCREVGGEDRKGKEKSSMHLFLLQFDSQNTDSNAHFCNPDWDEGVIILCNT